MYSSTDRSATPSPRSAYAAYPLPVLHSQGTSRSRLRSDYLTALRLFGLALDAFHDIEFASRDYNLHDNLDAFNLARTKRDEIRSYLYATRHYLERHLAHLAD